MPNLSQFDIPAMKARLPLPTLLALPDVLGHGEYSHKSVIYDLNKVPATLKQYEVKPVTARGGR